MPSAKDWEWLNRLARERKSELAKDTLKGWAPHPSDKDGLIIELRTAWETLERVEKLPAEWRKWPNRSHLARRCGQELDSALRGEAKK